MKQKLEAIELAALRIACENELPKSTSDNLNLLFRSLVPLLRRQQDEIERLQQHIAHSCMNRSVTET
ncbi:MAG: hypothetical protein WAW39_19030 [Prosthecobacter sp.]|uniref:hypothetical protein n=1 Tax=Prosthecobacter sp. TaxID=1965333 RepID=UPI003BB0A43E